MDDLRSLGDEKAGNIFHRNRMLPTSTPPSASFHLSPTGWFRSFGPCTALNEVQQIEVRIYWSISEHIRCSNSSKVNTKVNFPCTPPISEQDLSKSLENYYSGYAPLSSTVT